MNVLKRREKKRKKKRERPLEMKGRQKSAGKVVCTSFTEIQTISFQRF